MHDQRIYGMLYGKGSLHLISDTMFHCDRWALQNTWILFFHAASLQCGFFACVKASAPCSPLGGVDACQASMPHATLTPAEGMSKECLLWHTLPDHSQASCVQGSDFMSHLYPEALATLDLCLFYLITDQHVKQISMSNRLPNMSPGALQRMQPYQDPQSTPMVPL